MWREKEGNRERKRAGIWKGIGSGKGQVYGGKWSGEKGRYMEGNRERKRAGIEKGIGRGKGLVYGRESEGKRAGIRK
jgi:hypothetical protein